MQNKNQQKFLSQWQKWVTYWKQYWFWSVLLDMVESSLSPNGNIHPWDPLPGWTNPSGYYTLWPQRVLSWCHAVLLSAYQMRWTTPWLSINSIIGQFLFTRGIWLYIVVCSQTLENRSFWLMNREQNLLFFAHTQKTTNQSNITLEYTVALHYIEGSWHNNLFFKSWKL